MQYTDGNCATSRLLDLDNLKYETPALRRFRKPHLLSHNPRLAERGNYPAHAPAPRRPAALCAPPQEALQSPLGHHMPNQRHFDDDRAVLVQEALDDELEIEEYGGVF